jgi:predicted O-methyltransferase YrrM
MMLRAGRKRRCTNTDLVWTPLALPTLKIVQKSMRPGAVIVADNTISSATGYKELLDYVEGSRDFRSVTLPYSNGLEVIVYKPETQ